MEDEGIGNICQDSPPPCQGESTPYMSQLANTYGIASQYISLVHQSLPNYIALLGGDPFGCISTCSPLNKTNILDRIEAAGLTWKAYVENYSGGCNGTSPGSYDPYHNPFVQFQDILNNTVRCSRIIDPGPGDSRLIQDLGSNQTAPNYMWLTPNLCNDMHDECDNQTKLGFGDAYLAGLVPQILNSALFQNTNSALFITFDEGVGYCPLNGSSEDCVYAIWAGPSVRRAYGSSVLYSHYSLLATLEKAWNLQPLTVNDSIARPMTEFFQSQYSPPTGAGDRSLIIGGLLGVALLALTFFAVRGKRSTSRAFKR
jgi:phosphatidylinositol-3-phosphatase